MQKTPTARNILVAFISLAKIRIVAMVLVACSIGFIIASGSHFDLQRLVWILAGTAFFSAGACALNCYMERRLDALMPRTSRRPLPAGTISPASALIFGVSLVLAGFVALVLNINWLSAILGLTSVFIYLAIYTPAKRMTWINTPIGALPGAIPPLMGWAAARGEIDPGGWILFAMLFLWQHVHFFPIAWLYRNDYERAGFRMLSVVEPSGNKTFLFTVLSAIALLPISLLLNKMQLAGSAYAFCSTLLGALLIAGGLRLYRQRSRAAARVLLLLCLVYLPAILAAVIIDRNASLSAGFSPLLGINVQFHQLFKSMGFVS